MKVIGNTVEREWDAIVLGLDINGLGVVRSLRDLGLNVLGIYASNNEIGRFSRYCKACRIDDEGGSMMQNLLDFLERMTSSASKKPVIFPTSDYFVKFINDKREILEKKFLFMLPEKELLYLIMSKECQYELAQKHNLLLPETFRFSNFDDLKKQKELIIFPCILKPLDSFSGQLPGNEKNMVFNSFEEMYDYISKHPDVINNSIVQEIISGGDKLVYYCTMYFDEKSEPLCEFSARKIRQYKPDFGITCFAESEKVQEIIDISTGFLREINFKGLVDIEFIKDERYGTFKFIEMNPRTHWANSHSTSSGVNLPCIAYADMSKIEYKQHRPEQKDGVRWIYLKSDIGSYIRKRKEGRISLFEWLSSIITSRSFACFSIKDPLPFIIDSYKLLSAVLAR